VVTTAHDQLIFAVGAAFTVLAAGSAVVLTVSPAPF
jgi:hypothetical protein